jgi:hypothetical protein
MAEYTQTTTYDKNMQDKIRMWSNTTTKRFIENFNSLVDAELTLVDAGVAAYTFTPATWEKAVTKALSDLNNETNRRCFKWFMDMLKVEFTDIAATGMAYTKTYSEIQMRRCFDTASNSIHRELIHEMITLIWTELDAIEDAS